MHKIIYIAIIDKNALSGVANKIFGKINSLNKHKDVNATLITFTGKKSELINTKFEIVLPVEISYSRYAVKKNYRKIYLEIDKYLLQNKADSIIVRYPNASSGLFKLMQKHPKKIFLEHNTKEIEELKAYFNELTCKDILYVILRLQFVNIYYNAWKLYSEIVYGKKIISLAKGIIGVTNEIAEYEAERASFSTPHFCIANGIQVSKFPKYDKPPFNNEIVFILLSGHANTWTGIERLVNSLNCYKGEIKIKVLLVGSFLPEAYNYRCISPKVKIEFLPSLSGNELDELIKNSHIGIGPLELYKKGLSEACALKTREYLARGLPVLLSYNEVDVSDNELYNEFIFKISNSNSLIDFEEIIDWYRKLYKVNYPEKIIQLASQTIDIGIKTDQLIKVVLG